MSVYMNDVFQNSEKMGQDVRNEMRQGKTRCSKRFNARTFHLIEEASQTSLMPNRILQQSCL